MAVCIDSAVSLQSPRRQEIQARFDGARVSSDGGAWLLREVDERLNIISQAAACFHDHRCADRVEHPLEVLLRQRGGVWRWATTTSAIMTTCETIAFWRWPVGRAMCLVGPGPPRLRPRQATGRSCHAASSGIGPADGAGGPSVSGLWRP